MSDYTEHLISMAGGDGEADPLTTVTEWARQWRLNPNIDKSGTIYNVWFDPEARAVELNLNDIESLLAMVREQRAALAVTAREAGAKALEDAADVIDSRAKNFAGFWVGKDMPELAKGSWSAMRHEERTIRARAAELRKS